MGSEELKIQILTVARKHFAYQGFHGASLKDIAGEAGVAGSLINYHFGDKNGLFRACMESFARDRLATVRRLLGQAQSREEMRVRIELFVDEMLTSIVADPHGFEIIDREVRVGNPDVVRLFKETLLVAFQAVVEFFNSARERGLLREGVDPFVAAMLLFSASADCARKEGLAKKFFAVSLSDSEWRSHFSRQVVNLFMNGVMQ